MRVSLINVNLVAQDAIGQSVLHQLRFFQRRGDEVWIYVMHPPVGMPEVVCERTRVVQLEDLFSGRDEHFARSDLYVYHYPGRYPLLESIKSLARGAVIFYYHNVTPPGVWGSDVDRDLLQHSADSAGALARYADVVVTPSEFNAQQLVEVHGLDPDDIRVLPLAVPLAQFSPGPKDLELVDQYGVRGRHVILFVGRMAGNKRVDLLVEALSLVQQQVPEAVLLLVGDHESNPAIQGNVMRAQARAAELGIAEAVIFTGRVDELPPYYRLASVYATASLHEGFGVPPIEAMASGVPVVASRATAHPEVIGEAGMLVEPGDARDLADKIVQVLVDDALCGELVRRGLARARGFSLERYEAGWAEIVAEAIAWLPQQPYPRMRSLLSRPAVIESEQEHVDESGLAIKDVLLAGAQGRLAAAADVMLRDYKVQSRIPVMGRFVAWLRHNLTSHLQGPYLDPMFERQVIFNRQVVEMLRQMAAHVTGSAYTVDQKVDAVVESQQLLQQQLDRVECLLNSVVAQLALLESEDKQ